MSRKIKKNNEIVSSDSQIIEEDNETNESNESNETNESNESIETLIIPQLLPIEKSHRQQLSDIKSNIIKMYVNRGFIKPENFVKYAKKFISDENDDMEYTINVDVESNYNTTIKNKKIFIKMLDYKISSVNKNSPIGEFLSKYHDEYKLLIVENINHKSEKSIYNYKTACEIFKTHEQKICIVDHILVPKHTVQTQEEAKIILVTYNAKKKDMPLISSTDPVARYYNMKPDDICKIERASVMTCVAPFYRIVVKSKVFKAKT
jgi:DNA-directed RNA polymerase subunit H (RpoH/RPB5)